MDQHTTTIVYIPGKKENPKPREADLAVYVDGEVKNVTIQRNKPKELKAKCSFELPEV